MQSKERRGKTCKSSRKSVKSPGGCRQNYSTKNSECKLSQEKSLKDRLAGQSVTRILSVTFLHRRTANFQPSMRNMWRSFKAHAQVAALGSYDILQKFDNKIGSLWRWGGGCGTFCLIMTPDCPTSSFVCLFLVVLVDAQAITADVCQLKFGLRLVGENQIIENTQMNTELCLALPLPIRKTKTTSKILAILIISKMTKCPF